VFTTPESAPEYSELQEGLYKVSGQYVEPLPGFEALAGYASLPMTGKTALVLGNSSRTLFKGFLDGMNSADLDADGTPDPVELWENMIVGLQTGFFSDAPWLSEAPPSGTLPAGQAMTIDVTMNAAGLTPGVYEASLHLLSDSGREPALVVPVRMIVPAYRAAINAGGGAYTDLKGEPWGADSQFVAGGFGYTNPKAKSAIIKGGIAGTGDGALFSDLREDPWEYRFDAVPAGVYQIELLFAEPQPNGKASSRLFDVIIENMFVLPSHDIAYEAGLWAADVHDLSMKVTDGQFNIRLVGRKGYQPPVISAVRVTHRPDF
jgi:hypothetical protein